MSITGFDRQCQACGMGTVKDTVRRTYRTQVRGEPFVVPDARIGVCDACGIEHHSGEEIERWNRLFEEAQAKRRLGAADIRNLRETLQLSMEQFAALVGCTRQSLHHWERANRKRPQSLMADLMLRLVGESQRVGEVHVLEFLRDQAEEVGMTVPAPQNVGWKPVALRARRAADDDLEQTIVLADADTQKRVGKLFFDSESDLLAIEFAMPPEMKRFDAEIWFKDGRSETVRSVEVIHGMAILLKGPYSADYVEKVVILPPSGDKGRRRQSRR